LELVLRLLPVLPHLLDHAELILTSPIEIER